MHRQESHLRQLDVAEEALLDMDISGAEAVMAGLQNSAPKKYRLSRKQRQKRVADMPVSTEDAEPSEQRPSNAMPPPKITLRPLLVSQSETGEMSAKDIRDIFYTIMDGIQEVKKKQDRMEDRLRCIDTRTRSLEAWTMEFDARKKNQFVEQQPGCPTVPHSRYCEVCFVAGHQAAECRSKPRMDPAHVEKIYKTKNICNKCHCIHPVL